MTWSLHATTGAGANFLAYGTVNTFGATGQIAYKSNNSVDIWLYDIGTDGDTQIADAGDFSPNATVDGGIVLVNGTLYYVGASQVPNRRQAFSYDGTPNNWTHLATLDTAADLSADIDMSVTCSPDRTRLMLCLGRRIADGSQVQIGSSADGITWDLESVFASDTARSLSWPVPVKSDDTYFFVLNASSLWQVVAYASGAWTVDGSTYDPATYGVPDHNWVDQERANAGFSGIWLFRQSDNVMLRSTNGGSSFAVTQTDTAADFVLSTGNERVWSLNGYEFAVSALGGTTRLWYFNGSVWKQVDTGALPNAAIVGVVEDEGTLYLLYQDDLYTSNEFVFPSSGDTWDAAPMASKPCSIDADGQYIYIAALNAAGFPVLIQFSTALDSDGSLVFNPGAGSDIGVECSPTNPDVIWIAGAFDSTNTVERSINGAVSFVVEDPGTFAPVTAFDVGPDSDERVIVATETTGSIGLVNILETVDGGDNWTEHNAGLATPASILAMDRYPVNPEELVFGNANNTTDRSDYTPNSGYDLDDITSGLPTFDATGVIVG